MKEITILMSTYNGENFLNEQLESIQKQKCKMKIRVIVRDDGSTDSSIKVLESWRNKLNLEIIKGENKGVVNSFEELIINAPDSDYYAFADQDDVWNKEKLQVAIDAIENSKSNSPCLYFSNAKLVDENLNDLECLVHEKNVNIDLSKIMVCNPALGCTIVFNKKLIEVYRQVRISKSPMHDKTILIVGYISGKVIYDHTPRILYRQHRNNVMAREKGVKKRIRQLYNLWIKSDNCSLQEYSSEFLSKMELYLSEKDEKTLILFSNYKSKIKYKTKIILSKEISTGKYRVDRSFKLRVLLGLA